MGKESKKTVDLCICITNSLWCTHETNTTLINYAPPQKRKYKSPNNNKNPYPLVSNQALDKWVKKLGFPLCLMGRAYSCFCS